MLLTWTSQAWEDYLYWQATDKRTVKRINRVCCVMRSAIRLKALASRSRSALTLRDAGPAASIRKTALCIASMRRGWP